MQLRTTINIEKSTDRISYSDPVMFIGSCFASEIGSRLQRGKMPVMINPAGTVYNPVSVINTLSSISSDEKVTREDLFCHNDMWCSFSHYTVFSSPDPLEVVEKINRSSANANGFLRKARFLFITFGTARVFRLKRTGEIVSNCHKLPATYFDRELLKPGEIVSLWNNQLSLLQAEYPGLKVIFTISPVRHWKDGAHGNQVSKSVLFLAVEELLRHPSSPGYFPAYEIIMDDLRDYRFYDEDMLHPSQLAIDYIWEAFSDCYLDRATILLWKEAEKITRAMDHRIMSEDRGQVNKFAESMLKRISGIESSMKDIDFTVEKEYFKKLTK